MTVPFVVVSSAGQARRSLSPTAKAPVHHRTAIATASSRSDVIVIEGSGRRLAAVKVSQGDNARG
jgi:hypothetical protein